MHSSGMRTAVSVGEGRVTDRCKDITLPQLRLRAVMMTNNDPCKPNIIKCKKFNSQQANPGILRFLIH